MSFSSQLITVGWIIHQYFLPYQQSVVINCQAQGISLGVGGDCFQCVTEWNGHLLWLIFLLVFGLIVFFATTISHRSWSQNERTETDGPMIRLFVVFFGDYGVVTNQIAWDCFFRKRAQCSISVDRHPSIRSIGERWRRTKIFKLVVKVFGACLMFEAVVVIRDWFERWMPSLGGTQTTYITRNRIHYFRHDDDSILGG